METTFNYCDKDVAFFSSDERKWINKIHKLKQKFPDRITILAEPENNDGCIYCKLPPSALKVQLFEPRQSQPITEERRAAMVENLARAREAKKNG